MRGSSGWKTLVAWEAESQSGSARLGLVETHRVEKLRWPVFALVPHLQNGFRNISLDPRRSAETTNLRARVNVEACERASGQRRSAESDRE